MEMTSLLGAYGHGFSGIVYAGMTLWFLASWRRGALGAWLTLACGVSAVWSATVAFDAWTAAGNSLGASLLETLRSAVWLMFMAGVLASGGSSRGRPNAGWILVGLIVVLALLLIGGDFASRSIGDPAASDKAARLFLVGRLGFAVVGLAVVENFYRNMAPQRRWSIKYFCLGVIGIFSYDLVLYAEALLYGRPSPELLAARGFTNAMVAPLFVIASARNPDWSLDVFVSRKVALHTATLVGAGGFLLFMALGGYYLREIGGSWGGVAQIAFLFGTAIVLGSVLVSGRIRSYIAVLLSKHFFSYKYDYREEWLRFIHTMTSHGDSEPLYGRVIKAVADVVDSPEGGLWLSREDGGFALAREWNRRLDPTLAEAVDGPLARLLAERGWVLDLRREDAKEDPQGAHQGIFEIPEWLSGQQWAWLVVPLSHHDRLVGFLVLGHPRAPRDLNWEDFDLLKILGSQVASYLVEHDAQKALQEARQFEIFNRRFAFVLHDIKNLVSQLGLIVSNAERFWENPEFQRDMVATVRDSVDKMNHLLARLHHGRDEDGTAPVELTAFLRQVVHRMKDLAPKPSLDIRTGTVLASISEDKLETALSHLVGNAMEAASPDGTVTVRLLGAGDEACIEVIDDGPGMDAEFIRDKLFLPFRSTKAGGYGIGAYESRQLVEEMGGRLDVKSEVGEGTTMRIVLPALSALGGSSESTQMAAG